MYTRRVLKKSLTQDLDGKTGPPPRSGSPAAQAVALGYNPDQDAAPRVLASGKGYLANQIIEIAKTHGIQIREDPALAAALADVDIDGLIPPDLYTLVAELLAFVYRVRQRHTSGGE